MDVDGDEPESVKMGWNIEITKSIFRENFEYMERKVTKKKSTNLIQKKIINLILDGFHNCVMNDDAQISFFFFLSKSSRIQVLLKWYSSGIPVVGTFWNCIQVVFKLYLSRTQGVSKWYLSQGWGAGVVN